MEQGRSRPGRPIVIRLAESLGLTLRERNALLLSAGYAPAFGESDLNGPLLRPVRQAVEQVIEGHLPYPAMVLRGYGQVVAANRAVAVFVEDADPALLRPPVNLLRLMLHPNGMAPAVQNLGQWGRHVVENLRARARSSPNPDLDAFITELEGYLPEFAAGPDHLGFSVPLRLRRADGELHLLTTLTSFATAVDVALAELHLKAFLPAGRRDRRDPQGTRPRRHRPRHRSAVAPGGAPPLIHRMATERDRLRPNVTSSDPAS